MQCFLCRFLTPLSIMLHDPSSISPFFLKITLVTYFFPLTICLFCVNLQYIGIKYILLNPLYVQCCLFLMYHSLYMCFLLSSHIFSHSSLLLLCHVLLDLCWVFQFIFHVTFFSFPFPISFSSRVAFGLISSDTHSTLFVSFQFIFYNIILLSFLNHPLHFSFLTYVFAYYSKLLLFMDNMLPMCFISYFISSEILNIII